MNGKVEYVFEGNLNYTGAVMTWLRKDVGLIENDVEATELAKAANPNDRCYFVPAFSGLGAPYWDSKASGLLTGVSRTTGRAEIAKACLECIAYQITDLTELMRRDAGVELASLRVDGGPTASEYLMQFQSDMARHLGGGAEPAGALRHGRSLCGWHLRRGSMTPTGSTSTSGAGCIPPRWTRGAGRSSTRAGRPRCVRR